MSGCDSEGSAQGLHPGRGLRRGAAGRGTSPGHDPEQEEVWTEPSPRIVGIGRALRFQMTSAGFLPRPGCHANHECAKGRDGKDVGAQPRLQQGEPHRARGETQSGLRALGLLESKQLCDEEDKLIRTPERMGKAEPGGVIRQINLLTIRAGGRKDDS